MQIHSYIPMIPEFCQRRSAPYPMRKLLPVGVWPCTLAEMQDYFVYKFRSRERREELFTQFMDYRDLCVEHGLCGEHWVDGSFTTGYDRPDDIDLITFVSSKSSNSNFSDCHEGIGGLLQALKQKEILNLHNRIIVCYDSAHKDFFDTSVRAKEWIDLFTRTRKWKDTYGQVCNGYEKGIIKVSFGEKSKAPDVHQWLSLQASSFSGGENNGSRIFT